MSRKRRVTCPACDTRRWTNDEGRIVRHRKPSGERCPMSNQLYEPKQK